MQPKTPSFVFANVRDFGEIYSDDFNFGASVKDDYHEGAAICKLQGYTCLVKQQPFIKRKRKF